MKRSSDTRGTGWISGWLCVAALVVCVPTLASSAPRSDQQPLSMTFVDATPQQSGAIYQKLRSIIQNSDGLRYTSASDFLFAAEPFQVTLDVLAEKERRRQHRQFLKRAMIANELESIIVYKRLPDTFHLVVLGPNGGQVKHFRSPVRRSNLTDRQALAVLKRIFKVLIPEVRAYRKKQRRLDKTRKTVEDKPLPPAPGPTESDVDEASRARGVMTRGIAFAVTPLVGYRSLTLSTGGPFRLQHATPFFGARAKVDSLFWLFGDDDRNGLGASGSFGFAPFSTSFPNETATYTGNYIDGDLEVTYMHALSSRLRLYGRLGIRWTSIGIASNATYVGSTYTLGRFGPGVLVRFGSLLSLDVSLSGLPVLSANSNDGAFGPNAFTFGFNGAARATLTWLDPFRLGVFYDLSYVPLSHPNPKRLPQSASGSDTMNVFGLSAGYTL